MLFAEPFARRSVTHASVVLVGGTERVRRGVRKFIGETGVNPQTPEILVLCEANTLRDWRGLALQLSPVSDLAELLAIFPAWIAGPVTKLIIYVAGFKPVIPFRRMIRAGC